MRKRRMADSEIDELQQVRRENKKLKQQISQLRKQISRIDVDRFQNLKDVIEAQEREDRREEQAKIEADDRRRWACWDCQEGSLRLCVLERRDGVVYNRVCDKCGKRTKFQKYTSKVQG